MRPGSLRERVTFSQRSSSSDDYGNVEDSYVDQFSVAARIQYLRGGEGVMAARLDGHQPVLVTVRRSTDTEKIKPDWRVTDARDPARIFNIRSIVPDERRELFDLLCEIGVAA